MCIAPSITDKAVSPVNLYGATKLCAEKLFVQGNAYSGDAGTKFSCARYGNVLASRGSVIPLFKEQYDSDGVVTVTDKRMTRFWISLQQGVEFVLKCLQDMCGGEIYVKKIPSMRVTDLAKVIAPKAEHELVGVRPGEKIHEQMISAEDAFFTYEYPEHYKILPQINDWGVDEKRIRNGIKVPDGFIYTSDTNTQWMSDEELRTWINANKNEIGKI